jgi:hypothetical protein
MFVQRQHIWGQHVYGQTRTSIQRDRLHHGPEAFADRQCMDAWKLHHIGRPFFHRARFSGARLRPVLCHNFTVCLFVVFVCLFVCWCAGDLPAEYEMDRIIASHVASLQVTLQQIRDADNKAQLQRLRSKLEEQLDNLVEAHSNSRARTRQQSELQDHIVQEPGEALQEWLSRPFPTRLAVHPDSNRSNRSNSPERSAQPPTSPQASVCHGTNGQPASDSCGTPAAADGRTVMVSPPSIRRVKSAPAFVNLGRRQEPLFP